MDFSAYCVNMDWQQVASLSVVAAAAGLLVWSKLRRRRFSFERHGPCGCAAASQTGSQSSIVLHARKGQRPEVRVKMK
jgi:hypothetical protein